MVRSVTTAADSKARLRGMSPPLCIQLLMRCRISWLGPVCLHERVCLPTNQGKTTFLRRRKIIASTPQRAAAGLIPERAFICSEGKQRFARVTATPAQVLSHLGETCQAALHHLSPRAAAGTAADRPCLSKS